VPEETAGTAASHYFSAQPSGSGRQQVVPVVLAGRELDVVTAGGVFSADRLDLGTRVLLREAPPPPPTGNLLDLGCGWGPLAITLGLLSPAATVWAVDVNERALELTTENARRAGVRRLRAVPPDRVPADLGFEAIWSNPPIRIGKEALHELMLRWVPRLRPGAEAHLVVQRNLGADSLHAWLAGALEARATVERTGSAKGYRVLRVVAAEQ